VTFGLDDAMAPDPDVVATDLGGGETVLLHLRSKSYFTLNATGTRIWEGLTRGLTPRVISERLQREFRVEPERADRSVLELLRDLASQKLVRQREGGSPRKTAEPVRS
jgi:hypothetical protein